MMLLIDNKIHDLSISVDLLISMNKSHLYRFDHVTLDKFKSEALGYKKEQEWIKEKLFDKIFSVKKTIHPMKRSKSLESIKQSIVQEITTKNIKAQQKKVIHETRHCFRKRTNSVSYYDTINLDYKTFHEYAILCRKLIECLNKNNDFITSLDTHLLRDVKYKKCYSCKEKVILSEFYWEYDPYDYAVVYDSACQRCLQKNNKKEVPKEIKKKQTFNDCYYNNSSCNSHARKCPSCMHLVCSYHSKHRHLRKCIYCRNYAKYGYNVCIYHMNTMTHPGGRYIGEY